MPKKKKEKSPYGKYSIEQVLEAENGNYYIQLGSDIFISEEGKMAFKKERAEHFFDNIWEGLLDLKENGTSAEKDEAILCFLMFKIYPMRIH